MNIEIKIAGRNTNNLRYADDTTFKAESEEELNSLLLKVKEESEKVGLKLNIQKTKIMTSGRITSWQIDGETMERVSSVQFSCSVVSNSLWPHGLQNVRLSCPSPTSGACSNSFHRISDAIQPSHPLSSPSLPPFNLSQHQGLFKWVSSSHQVAKVLELHLQHQDWFPLGLTGLISLQSKGFSRVFCNTTVQKHQFFGTQPPLWSALTSIHDKWKNHSFD